uniref:Uncharacterized protein n=1 Tax=Dunaliella tertiolecta TaxID=3047 RepID=A0A7S3QQ79_DUNTE
MTSTVTVNQRWTVGKHLNCDRPRYRNDLKTDEQWGSAWALTTTGPFRMYIPCFPTVWQKENKTHDVLMWGWLTLARAGPNMGGQFETIKVMTGPVLGGHFKNHSEQLQGRRNDLTA